jgi:hypothetical protein
MNRILRHSEQLAAQQPGRLFAFFATWQRRVAGSLRLPLGGRLGGGFLLLLLLLFVSVFVQAQTSIGGADLPLKYSTHNYKITMGNPANKTEWRMYKRTASRDSIEGLLVFRYTGAQYFSVDPALTGKNNGVDSITIEFTGVDLLIGVPMTLVYREEGATDKCVIYKFFDFTVQEPIDIDADPENLVRNLSSCPDDALNYLEGDGSLNIPPTQTTITYEIRMMKPDGVTTVYDPPLGENWGFRYDIKVTGISGASAVISAINFNPSSLTLTPNATSWGDESPPISNSITSFEIMVTYNDVPGVRQKIEFNLINIHGSYGEIDVDERPPFLPDQNDLTHFITSMPRPSYIAALD